MKRNVISLLGCLLVASCTINHYHVISANDPEEASINLGRLPVASKQKNEKLRYDKALPVVPELSVIQDASHYNPEDKYTFPILGNETAVKPPKDLRRTKTLAIWCTEECTVVASLAQLQWDLHYFQQSSNSYIEDCETGKKYYLTGTYDKRPLDISYNIKGVAGEWICLFDLYPPLPKECTTINIIEGQITDDVKNGPGWNGSLHIRNVPVAMLQANQGIAQFHKTRIIE